MQNQAINKKRTFSVELKSKANLKSIMLANGSPEGVTIEGMLGELEHAKFAEGIVLEVICSNGVLRIDLGENEIEKPMLRDQKGEMEQ